jgi:hypothetical protein
VRREPEGAAVAVAPANCDPCELTVAEVSTETIQASCVPVASAPVYQSAASAGRPQAAVRARAHPDRTREDEPRRITTRVRLRCMSKRHLTLQRGQDRARIIKRTLPERAASRAIKSYILQDDFGQEE